MVDLKKNLDEDAAHVFRNLTERYSGDPLHLYHYGLALLASGQKADAKVELEAALP